jgi:DNA-directed RNA polymerase subunit H (RpoH/RPB5)
MKLRFSLFKKTKEEEEKTEHEITEGVSELNLKVSELLGEDVNKGIIRIDETLLKKLGIKEGDVVEIIGKKKTVAIAIRSHPADVGLNIIRMDGITRGNAGSGVGEYVKVRKADVKEARSVTLAPAQKGVMIQISPNLVKKNIYKRPATKGDIIIPSPIVKEGSVFEKFFGIDFERDFDFFFTPMPTKTKFVVVNTNPSGIVRVDEITEVEILPELPEALKSPLKEKDLPLRRIIKVKNLPDLQNMMEVKSLDEIAKLAEGYYINKYEDKGQVIYFTGNWYLRIRKSPKK